MKIEIKDNILKCTISRAELEERQIKISELAQGTTNAKKLFFEIVKNAETNYDFQSTTELFLEANPIDTEEIMITMKNAKSYNDLKSTYIDSCWEELQGKKPANDSRNRKPQHNKSRSAERTDEASKTEMALLIFGIAFLFLILAIGLSL